MSPSTQRTASLTSRTFVGVPGTFVTTGRWDNIEKLRDFQGPLLHFHGVEDLTVREALGRELFDAVGSTSKAYVPVEGAAHGNFIPGVDDDVAPDVPAVLGEQVYADRIGAQLDQDCGRRAR